MNGVERARKVAGISGAGAAAIIGVTLPTWYTKEKDPLKFTIGQFFTLYRELDTDAREILWGYMEGMRDGASEAKKFCA